MELDPSLVTIDALGEEDAESMRREFIDDYTRAAARDITGRYVEGPLLDGVRSYSVHGFVPTGRPHPVEKGKMLNRVGLRVGMSSNPRQDVERALMVGCTSVTVALNYEPSEVEKYGQEEFDRQERENLRRREEFMRK